MGKGRPLRFRGRKHIPLPSGPYAVGCTDIMTSYSRTSVFVRMYYPSEETNILDHSSRWPEWLPHKKYLKGYASYLGYWPPMFCKFFPLFVGDLYIPAIWNAEPLRNRDKFPVVIFSHGLGACRVTYSTFCLELASQGYIVAAVEHRDESACMTYYLKEYGATPVNTALQSTPTTGPSGTEDEEGWEDVVEGKWKSKEDDQKIDAFPTVIKEWINFKPGPLDDYPLRNKQVKQRTKECIRALDLLDALNKGQEVKNVLDPLFSRWKFLKLMDMSRVAIAGHSFGGATVIVSLAADKRFRAGVTLDPWMVPLQKDFNLFPLVSQPMLSVNMEKFQTKENLALLSNLDSNDIERKFIMLRGTVHLNQTDVPFICDAVMRTVVGADSSMNRFTAMDLTTRLSMDFLSKHLDLPSNPDHQEYITHQEKKLQEGIKLKKSSRFKKEENAVQETI